MPKKRKQPFKDPNALCAKPPKGGARITAGRPPGAKNKVSQAIRDQVLEALDKLGGVKWLIKTADKNPALFISLLARCLPMEVNATLDHRYTVIAKDLTGKVAEIIEHKRDERPMVRMNGDGTA